MEKEAFKARLKSTKIASFTRTASGGALDQSF